jgi:cell division protein FtsB
MSVAPIASVGRTRARGHLTPRGAILALVVVALLLSLVVPLRTYVEQRNRLNHLERQTQVLEDQNRRLQAAIARLHDPAYIEQFARECLHMLKEGEIGFVVVPESGQASPPPC